MGSPWFLIDKGSLSRTPVETNKFTLNNDGPDSGHCAAGRDYAGLPSRGGIFEHQTAVVLEACNASIPGVQAPLIIL
jgi:hypothetical protein